MLCAFWQKDRQLNDMVSFCTNDEEFSVVGVDPTFNLGDFSVTVSTYRHLQLIDRTTKKHPVMLGPMLVHQMALEIHQENLPITQMNQQMPSEIRATCVLY